MVYGIICVWTYVILKQVKYINMLLQLYDKSIAGIYVRRFIPKRSSSVDRITQLLLGARDSEKNRYF